jgi:hypothetical protein
MKMLAGSIVLGALMLGAGLALALAARKGSVAPAIASFAEERIAEFDRIPDERRKHLEKLAAYVHHRVSAGDPARLTFICTHNSRRSQMAQLWAETAAAYFGIDGVETYSGGTEATAFHPRAVAALERAGFAIEKMTEERNPVYEVRYHEGGPALRAFSKRYDEEPNPSEDFCAVTTCARAETSCPIVYGASLRVAIPYDDPGVFDGTEREAAAYDERCRQIAREMLYLFSRVGAR